MPEDNWIAILDPIDGTENFTSGLKEWGVALSLWKNKIHYGSALYLPELNEFIISGQKIRKYNSRIVGLSSSYNKDIGDLIAEKKSQELWVVVYIILIM